jgi:hypothetical protein
MVLMVRIVEMVALGGTPLGKPHLVGPVNGLNVEHRTSNIERPMWMALRFIYFKKSESKFDVGGSMFDVRRSLVSFLIRPAVVLAGGWADT